MIDQSFADRFLVFKANARKCSLLRDAGLPLPNSVCLNGPIADCAITQLADVIKARP